MSRVRLLVAGLVLASPLAAPLDAQLYDQAGVRLGPQIVKYSFKAPLDETVTELAIPLFATVPLGGGFSMDVGTAYAQSKVEFAGGESQVSGPTDTQVRASWAMRGDRVVLTAGANLPTGKSTVALNELPAASRIGNDFLSFPISNFGTGTALTGGLAVAQPLGAWNVGAGGSVRVASAFEPVRTDSGPLPRYQPGNEYKVRVGLDRPVGAGQLAFGVTFSTFGQDEFGGSLYNTGDRLIAQAGITAPSRAGTFALSAWNMYRGEGEIAGGQAIPWDDIANVALSLAMRGPGGTTLEPGVQVRSWWQRVAAAGSEPARTDRSVLAELGGRARIPVFGVAVYPGAGYVLGTLASGGDARADLTGFRASLGLQLR